MMAVRCVFTCVKVGFRNVRMISRCEWKADSDGMEREGRLLCKRAR